MILALLLIGFLSAFALGPSSFNIIRDLLSRKRWPWKAILGFLLADLVLISLSLVLLRSPWLQNSLSKTVLTLVTVLSLSFYALQILFKSPSLALEAEHESKNSFAKSFLLGLCNVHLVLIYAGLFINVAMDGDIPFQPALIYFLSFLVSFLSMLWIVRTINAVLAPLLRHLELMAAFGFLLFSAYLSWGIL